MEIFQNHLVDWLILLGLLGLGLFIMRSVGEERSTFKDESYEVQFGQLSLMIPRWWSITGQSESHLQFGRTDTRYDWYARFQYFPDHQQLDMPKLLEE